MPSAIVADLLPVWQFVTAQTGVGLASNMHALGLERDGRLVAGVLFEGWNPSNVWMHVAITPGEYLTPSYVRACFAYPFEQVGVRRVSGWVEESNLAARRLDEHLGFRPETRLKGAASDGGDVLIYVMWRDWCRWLRKPSMAPSPIMATVPEAS